MLDAYIPLINICFTFAMYQRKQWISLNRSACCTHILQKCHDLTKISLSGKAQFQYTDSQ